MMGLRTVWASGMSNVRPDPSVSCFAAGTLVYTKEGLKPIEQIKVGDYVLSKPENGGKQEYKRVLQTFAMPPERVIRVNYRLDSNKTRAYSIMSTLNHPFWVKDQGWTAAENLTPDWVTYKQLVNNHGVSSHIHTLSAGPTAISPMVKYVIR